MAMPVLNTPILECTLPISKQKIAYRPYLVKEEKIMLTIAETISDKSASEMLNEIYIAIKSIVDACTFNKLDIKKLNAIDFEYLFLKIKSASRGNISSASYKCKLKDENGVVCGHISSVEFDTDNIETIVQENSSLIKLNDSIAIQMKMPTLDDAIAITTKALEKNSHIVEYDLILKCVESIIDGEDVITEFTLDELSKFIDNLTERDGTKLTNYVKKLPKNVITKSYVCEKCNKDHKVEVSNIKDFFTYH